MKISDIINGKRIMIWGYGLEGKSMERFIKMHTTPQNCTVYEGPRDDINENDYDLIIKSPGIVADISDNNRYTSMTSLFLEEFSDRIIGITGTKGKSTVTSLLASVLSKATDKNVVLVGNIGLPCLDYYDEITDDTIIVFEMSCHQLEYAKRSPHIAVLLNLFPEHLDHYGSVERYYKAKLNITKHQKQNDYLVIGEQAVKQAEAINSPITASVSATDKTNATNTNSTNTNDNTEPTPTTVVIPESSPQSFNLKLAGTHNQFNARVVYTICREIFGCTDKEIRNALLEFKGLSHRLEYVGTYDGIAYYDDSISTIPEAMIAAAGSIPEAQTMLVGGMDRDIPYDVLIRYVREHSNLNYIFMYASGKRIYEDETIKDLPFCYYRDDLEAAVSLAKEITKSGGACILSPAAASYGYFKNFEERGDVFAKLVKA